MENVFEEYQKDIYQVQHKAIGHPDDYKRGMRALKNLWKSLEQDMKGLTPEQKEEVFARKTFQFLNRTCRDWMREDATDNSR